MYSGFTTASSMTVNILGGGLIVLGLVLLLATLAFWKAAAEDPLVLAPLEVMADRKFARADDTLRLAMLNGVRPEGAEAVVHHVSVGVLAREPLSEPDRPYVDRYPHDDDAVDIVPSVIDPLLNQQSKSK